MIDSVTAESETKDDVIESEPDSESEDTVAARKKSEAEDEESNSATRDREGAESTDVDPNDAEQSSELTTDDVPSETVIPVEEPDLSKAETQPSPDDQVTTEPASDPSNPALPEPTRASDSKSVPQAPTPVPMLASFPEPSKSGLWGWGLGLMYP